MKCHFSLLVEADHEDDMICFCNTACDTNSSDIIHYTW